MNDVKDDAMYSITEIMRNELTKLPLRTVQRYAKKHHVKNIDNSYKFFGYQIKAMNSSYAIRHANTIRNRKIKELKNVKIVPPEAEELDGYITETFTEEEHEQLQKLIFNEPLKRDKLQDLVDTIKDYKLQIEYLRKSLDGKDEQMNLLIYSIKDSLETIKETQKNMQQRNYLEVLREQEKGSGKK